MLEERGIEKEWVARVIGAPERDEAHAHDVELRYAIGQIPEYGNRWLRVVYNSSLQPVRIVTAYFDRSVRGKP